MDDHHRNPNSNDSDHLVGQLTTEPSAPVLTSAVSLTLYEHQYQKGYQRYSQMKL